MADVAAVVFDEVHERSLDMDLALALCLDLQQLGRPELRCRFHRFHATALAQNRSVV